MSILQLLLENIRRDDDTIARIIRKKISKVIRSEYYEMDGTVLDKDRADEVSYIVLKKDRMDELISKIHEADPSNKGKYTTWIISNYVYPIIEKRYSELIIKFNEDYYKLKEYLRVFEDNKVDIKRQGYDIDIHSYNSLQELYNVIRKFTTPRPDEGEYSEEEVMENDFYIKNREAEVIYTSPDSMVVRPLTLEASKFYGCTTQWCTIYPDSFKRYTNNGLLIIFIKVKNTEPENRAQLALDNSYDYDVEFRYSNDEWVRNPLNFITVEEAKSIQQYLSNDDSYTYKGKPVDANSIDLMNKDGYSIITKNGKQYAKFKEWSDMAHMIGKDWDKFAKGILSGDYHEYYQYDHLSYDDIDRGNHNIDIKTVEEIKKRFIELVDKDISDREYIDEIKERLEEVDDMDELNEFFDWAESGDAKNVVDEIKSIITSAYREVSESTDADKAYKAITNHIADQVGMDLSDGVKWEGDYHIVPLEGMNEIDHDTVEVAKILSTVMNIDYLHGDEGEMNYESLYEPRYGFRGKIDDDHLNEVIIDRLYW